VSAAADRTLYFLTGATGVGKTEWALRWAAEHDAEILSCDALLFYRGMDIGTAKPSLADRARIAHHLIDILDPSEPMNVARYALLARAAVEEIARRGKRILVTGGSGFYLKSFFTATADDVAVPAAVRDAVAAVEAAGGAPALRAALEKLNPGGLGNLDVDNPRRLSRALERCLATGLGLAEIQAAFAALPKPFPGWHRSLVQLDRPREVLERRIAERTEAMLAAGLVGEVRALLAAGLAANPSASRAIGYREVIDFLSGEFPESELAAKITANTRGLVKKQRTWFRTQLPEHRVVDAGSGYRPDLFAT
jgi:tRNA dimethylallyltransferase